MLAPRCYVKDCLNICGVIVDHSLTPTCDKRPCNSAGVKHILTIPYNVDVSNETTYIDVASSISKLGYSLEEAASRQKVFYYQVSLPHYQDTKFIESAIGRYRKFLELKQCYPTFFIVPCYDVDVVWHAHQLHPVTYKEDTKVLLREHFNHDDSVNDRSPGSKLNVSDSETRTIWRKKYGENFASFGAMFRGLPPNGKLHKMSLEKMIIQYPKKVSIVIQQVHIADESVAKKTRSLEFIGILKSGTELKLLKMKKPAIGKGMWNADTHVQEKRELEFDTGMCETFTVALYKKGLFGNMGPKNIVGKASLDILRFINNCKAVNVTDNQTVELTVGSTNVRLDFDLTIVKYRDISYTFSPGTYEECIMPEFLEDLWGPVPLTRLPKGQDNKCNVASHRLRTTNGTVEFTVRTIHSLPCLMSVVQVFYHDKLSVVCHLIGPDTLPRRDQVTKKTKLTLTPSKGERAVVIKNNDGDWAVLTGNWTGLRKGIPGEPGRRGIPGSPGHLKISLYKMATGKWARLSLKNWNNTKDFSFTLDGVHVDMNP
ncbi:hypothetical protein FSP39_010151 [Pinctada imbricata]|uniref:Uncharacterized protein n=1 Tax=Pinctada imbricata TaxID=66713 RepID=A0AA88YCE8_PINIB|nr:hypothetical protein FSP39_010151 [Pinctada imbricata]